MLFQLKGNLDFLDFLRTKSFITSTTGEVEENNK